MNRFALLLLLAIGIAATGCRLPSSPPAAPAVPSFDGEWFIWITRDDNNSKLFIDLTVTQGKVASVTTCDQAGHDDQIFPESSASITPAGDFTVDATTPEGFKLKSLAQGNLASTKATISWHGDWGKLKAVAKCERAPK